MKLTINDNKMAKVRLSELSVGKGIEVIDSSGIRTIYIRLGIVTMAYALVITCHHMSTTKIDLIKEIEGTPITIQEITFLRGA